MTNTSFSFVLTILAGLSTMIGALFIFIKNGNKDKIITSSLAFASGVMISVSITDLIPESLKLLITKLSSKATILISFLSILLGIILSMIINYYLPDTPNDKVKNTSLYKVGIISMLAIILHNIPEGVITFLAGSTDIKLGLILAFTIAIHNIPEGISISIPIYYSTNSYKKALLYSLVSALSEPFGAFVAFIFLKDIINNTILGIMLSLVAGIMIEISITNLIPTAYKYYNKKYFYIFFLIGFFFMLLKYII